MKYVVHSGHVISPHDRDRHYITAQTVASLYGLKPNQWINGRNIRPYDTHYSTHVHLYPRSDGNYTLDNI